MWDKKNYIAEFKQMAIYQQKKLILNGLNFKIRAGEFIYILGGNASGKSSLLKILMGRLPLIEGEGRLFDFELKALDQLSLPILRRRLGILSYFLQPTGLKSQNSSQVKFLESKMGN
jgi:cell division transport system ATP-binding protein